MACWHAALYTLQVPHLDGFKSMQANAAARGTRGNALVAMAALADIAADGNLGQPKYIPLVSSAAQQLLPGWQAAYSGEAQSAIVRL